MNNYFKIKKKETVHLSFCLLMLLSNLLCCTSPFKLLDCVPVQFPVSFQLETTVCFVGFQTDRAGYESQLVEGLTSLLAAHEI